MALRRVITTEVDGRSTVLLDGEAPQGLFAEIWKTSGESPWGDEPDISWSFDDVRAGQTRFRMVTLPPDTVMRAALAELDPAVTGTDKDGFHSSATVDYVFVLDGAVELELDDTSVVLQPNDCAVQRGTRHAWRNHNEFDIRLLIVMVGTP